MSSARRSTLPVFPDVRRPPVLPPPSLRQPVRGWTRPTSAFWALGQRFPRLLPKIYTAGMVLRGHTVTLFVMEWAETTGFGSAVVSGCEE